MNWEKLSNELGLSEEKENKPVISVEDALERLDEKRSPSVAKSIKGYEMLPRNGLRQPTWSSWSTEKATKEGLKASAWVYTCVKKLADSASSARWHAEQKVGDKWVKSPGSPLQILINKPNPNTTTQTLIEQMTYSLNLAGNALVSKIRGFDETPKELWFIYPDQIKPVPGKSPDDGGHVMHYLWKDGTRKKKIETNDVMHAMFTDINNVFWGLSPLQAAARDVDVDVEAGNYQKSSLENRAVSDGVFTIKQNITAEQYTTIKTQIRDEHQGSKNAYTPWVLGADMDWQQMSMTPMEMDFLNSRAATATRICAVFGVPEPVAGIMDNANYANVNGAYEIFWQTTMSNFLFSLASTLTQSVAREFGDDWRISYDISHIKSEIEAWARRMELAMSLWGKGIPFDVLNERFNLGFPEFDGSDVGYLSAGLVPVSAFKDMFDE